MSIEHMRNSIGGLLAIGIIAIDQISKAWMVHHLSLGDSIPITSFLNIRLAFNSGAAFSFLQNAGGWQRWFFIGLSLLVVIALLIFLCRAKENY